MITLEDVNGVNCTPFNTLYTLDTADIGTGEFSDVKLDFCIVSHSISGSNHTFTFKIVNDSWTGGFLFVNSSNNFVSNKDSYNSSTNTITFTYTESSIKLKLLLSNYFPEFSYAMCHYFVRQSGHNVTLDMLDERYDFEVESFAGHVESIDGVESVIVLDENDDELADVVVDADEVVKLGTLIIDQTVG